MSATSGFCERCGNFLTQHCNGDRNTCMSILLNKIEALQKENNGWQERYYELDAGHSRLFKDFCKLQKENEQLQAQAARMWEALRKAREAIQRAKENFEPYGEYEYDVRYDLEEALAEIDKAIGGKEDGK